MEELLNMIRREVVRVLSTRSTTRIGLVDSYDPQTHSAKVRFQPENELSGWIPVGTAMSGNGYGIGFAPSVNDQVLVHFLEGEHESGVIGMRLYSVVDQPPNVPAGEIWALHSSGSSSKFLTDGSVEHTSNQGHSLTVGADSTVNVSGNHTVSVSGDHNLSITGDHTVSAASLAISAPTSITGNASVDGDAAISGDTTMSGDASIAGATTMSGNASVGGNLNVGGSLTTPGGGATTLPVNGNVKITGNLQVTGSITGGSPTSLGTLAASEDLAAGAVCNIWQNGAAAAVRNADGATTGKSAQVFVMALVASGAAATIYGPGTVISGLSGLTPGATYYLAATGALSTTPETGSGTTLQEVGVALSATTLLFMPQAAYAN